MNILSTNNQNIFIRIPKIWRIVIIIYILIWQILPSVLTHILAFNTKDGFFFEENLDILLMLFFNICYYTLKILPFVSSSFFGFQLGWLHPLIFTTLLETAQSILLFPIKSLWNPFSMWFINPPLFANYPLFNGWSQEEILAVYLKQSYLNLLAITALYIGFILINIKPIHIKFFPPRQIKMKIITFCLMGLILFFYIINVQGGITESLSTLGKGRFIALENVRHFVVILQVLPYLFALWYLFQNRVIKTWYFWGMLIFASVAQFLVTGSRTTTLFPFVALTIAWIIINKKIPWKSIIALGLVIFILIGLLGDLRRSSWSSADGRADFSALVNFDFVDALSNTQEDVNKRPDATLGVFGYVPNKVPYLFGQSYISVIAFWIPRFIWKNKPRGGGAYAGAMIWNGLDSVEGYTKVAIPMNGVAEAYWNFSIPGVIIVYLLFGGYQRWLTNFFRKYSENGLAKIFYILSIGLFVTPTSPVTVTYIQLALLMILLGFALGVFRPFTKTSRKLQS